MFKKMLYVYTVYREQSFTKAAEKLYISQPSLSAAIKKTEQEIGFPLFERGFSHIRPTEVGLQYIRTIEEILRLQNDFVSYLEDMQSLSLGNLSVGGSNSISSYILPMLVEQFSSRYPKVHLHLVEASTLELERQIKSEDLDLIIDSFDPTDPLYHSTPLRSEKILLAVPKASPVNAAFEGSWVTPSQVYANTADCTALPPVPISAFAQEKFILLKSGNDMHRRTMQLCREAGITPNVAFLLDQLTTSYALAASGAGVCFITDTIFRYHRFSDEVCLYNIAGSGSRQLHIVHKNNRYRTRAMDAFIALACEMIR